MGEGLPLLLGGFRQLDDARVEQEPWTAFDVLVVDVPGSGFGFGGDERAHGPV